jgi:hypothetical protein
MKSLMSFADSISLASEKHKKPHVLLGNGFSRACRDNIFSYKKLLETANFKNIPKARKAFDKLQTTDFEVVMNSLRSAHTLMRLYSGRETALAKKLLKDSIKLREVLVSAIANNHPGRPKEISEDEYTACRRFLGNFESIYTINYDLLLYWTLMHDEIDPFIKCDDGFRQPEDGPAEWVSWDCSAYSQNIHYLHGALHIYEDGAEIKKFTWCNTQLALIDQIRAALNANKFPLFVAEGTSEQKMGKIIRSSFLGRAFRSFENIGGNLFLYGLSLSESDNHILKVIIKSKVSSLFISLHGNPTSSSNQKIIAKAKFLISEREKHNKRHSLKVQFYKAESAMVWA